MNETKPEYQFIQEILVGQDASLIDGVYTDKFLSEIGTRYPLDTVLGTRKDGISEGNWGDLNHFTMNSPLQNSEGEQVLNAILYNSANKGVWQPKVIDVGKLTDARHIETAEEYLKAVEGISQRYNEGMIDGGTIFGIAVAQRGGLVLPTRLENNVIVLPSQAFVDYCTSRNRS